MPLMFSPVQMPIIRKGANNCTEYQHHSVG
jgi:hypothetical protein